MSLTQAQALSHAAQAGRGSLRSLEKVLRELIGGDVGPLDNLDVVTLSINSTAITATAAEINRAADVSARIVNTTATTLSITEASHDGKIVTINSASPIAVTLPAASGSGAKFEFIIGTVATATPHTIKVANTTDVMAGVALVAATTTILGWATTATDDTISLDGTTTGGIVGDRIEITDVASGVFAVQMFIAETGTEATPFSATV